MRALCHHRPLALALALPLAVAALLLARPAAAQTDPCAGALDPARMVECLKGGIDPTTRGIKPAQPRAPAGGVPVQAPRTAPPLPAASVDLTVPFAFDSAELTGAGRAMLDSLALAMRDPGLATARFRIAGHTDAVGSAAYNQALSERRALAAMRHLVEQGGVAAGRLTAVGYGESQLYDPDHPEAAANRRVQVIRIEE